MTESSPRQSVRGLDGLADTPVGAQARLYQAAIDALKQPGHHARLEALRAAISDGFVQAVLIEWALHRYLDHVAADLAGVSTNSPPATADGGGGGHRLIETHPTRAAADSPSVSGRDLEARETRLASVAPEADSHHDDGPLRLDLASQQFDRRKVCELAENLVSRQPTPADRRAARKAAEAAAVTIMDTTRVRDGRAIGDIAMGELGTLIGANRYEAALLDLVRQHYRNASPFARVREIIKLKDLERMKQKAAEIADGQ